MRAVDLAWEVGEVLPEVRMVPGSPEGRWGLGAGTEITQAQEPGSPRPQGAQAPSLPLLGEVRGPGGPGRGSAREVADFLFPAFPAGRTGGWGHQERQERDQSSKHSHKSCRWGGSLQGRASAWGLVIPPLPLCFCFLFPNTNL